ncbi:MAG: Uma2 family endonuclease [Verrucomicrobiae bacterium]|nr:Uma2 family endonuclease [Verrucomicrobiae bacterium]
MMIFEWRHRLSTARRVILRSCRSVGKTIGLVCIGFSIRLSFSAMSSVLESPEIELAETDYHAFNQALWDRLSADSSLVDLDLRIETDRYGQMIMSPPPAPSHGNKQSEIAFLLKQNMPSGRVISECPVSTREGVKAIDVAWCSQEKWNALGNQSCFRESPEICVEVVSPGNAKGELEEKKALYFEEGAIEVWFCDRDGTMFFFGNEDRQLMPKSALVSDFPDVID